MPLSQQGLAELGRALNEAEEKRDARARFDRTLGVRLVKGDTARLRKRAKAMGWKTSVLVRQFVHSSLDRVDGPAPGGEGAAEPVLGGHQALSPPGTKCDHEGPWYNCELCRASHHYGFAGNFR